MSHTAVHNRNVIVTWGERSTTGNLEVQEFSTRDRLVRAVRTVALCLSATLACVFIPAAHFVLVPLGLLVTPLITILVFRAQTKILSAKLICPKCNAEIRLLASQEKYPLYERCVECGREVTIKAT